MSNPENVPLGSHPQVSPWWKWILLIGGVFALLAVPALLWNPFSVAVPPPDHAKKPEGPTQGLPWFEDVTQSSGIRFQHFDSATPRHLIQETMGSGIAWIDYDVDGWPDLFCVQSSPLQGEIPAALTSKLFRNNHDGSFTDVSETVGLKKVGFGMGAAVGDFDNDGFPDLVVSYLGDMALYHNQPAPEGSRRLVDIADAAGLKNPHWGTSIAWGDIDQDGDLDLYVCNYCQVDIAKYPICEEPRTKVAMCCPPSHFPAVAHKLFRNNGDLTFTDVSVESGVTAPSPAPGLAVAMVDLDADSRLDIYVANDMKPAYLFHNQGGGRFVEKALACGCALGLDGTLVAGMGIAVGDVEDSGLPSLFVTNFEKKPNILFLNRGKLNFRESSMRSGLGGASIPLLKFGTEFLDADLDGILDVAVANGHIHRSAKLFSDSDYQQPAQFFVGLGKARFGDVSAKVGDYFSTPLVGRGVAVADYDNDGKPDLAFSHVGETVKLLRNATPTTNHQIQLHLVAGPASSRRDAIGAKVEYRLGDRRVTRFVTGGGSYLSASDLRLHLGLGGFDKASEVVVTWPSGATQKIAALQSGMRFRWNEGGDPVPVR